MGGRLILTVTRAPSRDENAIEVGSKYLPFSLRWAPGPLPLSHHAHGFMSGVNPHTRA